MTRDERQKIGISKWVKANCRATLQWATGVGVKKKLDII
jgi:hypothetical protein